MDNTKKRSPGRTAGQVFVGLLLFVGAWLVPFERADAIPAFARKYDLSCNACHTRQPRLNWYGQRFLENGYQLPGTEDGGTTKKGLYGGPLDGVTLDDVANYLAVRLRADIQDAKFRRPMDTEATDEADIVFPNTINLFVAGTATRNFSFFLEGDYSTQDEREPALRFERAYVILDNLGGHQVASLKVGQFDPSAFFAFPTHRQQLNPIPPDVRTEQFPPQISRMPLLPFAFSTKMFGLTTGPAKVGGEGYALLPFEPYLFNAPVQTGLSVHGRPFGEAFLYQIGVAQNETAEDTAGTRWDPFAMLRYDVVRGDYNAFQVSAFYYRADKAARATLDPPPLDGDVYSLNALDWTRWGVGARWQHRYIDLYATVVWDEIDEPRFMGPPASLSKWDTDAVGASVELDWLLTSRWLLGVRYDYMDPGGLEELPPMLQMGAERINQKASFLGLIGKYYYRPNIALYARGHFNLESSAQLPAALGGIEHPARNLEAMYTVGLDMAF